MKMKQKIKENQKQQKQQPKQQTPFVEWHELVGRK